MTVIFHKSIESFWARNKKYCNENYYAVESLINVLNAHNQGINKQKITAAFNVEGNNSDVFGLWCYPSLMVYGSNFDESVITSLIDGIEPSKIDHAPITGQRDLILNLLDNIQKRKNTKRKERI